MAELERWLEPLAPPLGGAARLAARFEQRRRSRMPSWRPLAAGALGLAAISAVAIVAVRPGIRDAAIRTELAAALAAVDHDALRVEGGAAWAPPSTHDTVRFYVIVSTDGVAD